MAPGSVRIRTQITVVDPVTIVSARAQGRAPGAWIPHPLLAGTRWLAPSRGTTPESVTIHEAGHQFWTASSRPTGRARPLDEGFNTYSTARAR
jgi:hypothetical protein